MNPCDSALRKCRTSPASAVGPFSSSRTGKMCGSGTGSYDLVLKRMHRTRPSFRSWSFLVVKDSDEGVLAHPDDSVWPGPISSIGATLCFERV